MKKLLTICLIMATAFTVNAQDGKPTKEQTIQFIKDYFLNTRISSGVYKGDSDKEFKDEGVKEIDIQFSENNTKMTISYNHFFLYTLYYEGKHVTNTYNKYKYVIDFSKTEAISLLVDKRGNNLFEIDLYIKAAPGYSLESYNATSEKGFDDIQLSNTAKKESSINIPIKYYGISDPNFDHGENNKKIVQAFNHMRKLCGAPEPISFD